MEQLSPCFVDGALVVGAGPSGLATAASLKVRGIPSLMLEKDDCIGSLWRKRTYDRLHLHIPKRFCELPFLPFPTSFPVYPSRAQIVDYLDAYAENFRLKPLFNQTVVRAAYDHTTGVWRVNVVDLSSSTIEYVSRWLVVASGENCQPILPQCSGMHTFGGPIIHSSLYKNGLEHSGRKVLVVGSGNSGMEIALDLVTHGAHPSLAVRGQVHILPRDVLGISTFSLTNSLLGLKFPIWLVDMVLLVYSWLLYGDLSKVGLFKPKEGPIQMKIRLGKTPVLDVGAVTEIRAGKIKVVPGVDSFYELGATFKNGETLAFDAIILATGYKTSLPDWLEGGNDLFDQYGHPKMLYPHGWKGRNGLFAAGFTRRGLQGACSDAKHIADEIERSRRID